MEDVLFQQHTKVLESLSSVDYPEEIQQWLKSNGVWWPEEEDGDDFAWIDCGIVSQYIEALWEGTPEKEVKKMTFPELAAQRGVFDLYLEFCGEGHSCIVWICEDGSSWFYQGYGGQEDPVCIQNPERWIRELPDINTHHADPKDRFYAIYDAFGLTPASSYSLGGVPGYKMPETVAVRRIR